MAILAECPICHNKQAVKNKTCRCGADLDRLKRQAGKVRYWIAYRLPGGRMRRECVGFSLAEARDADGKRRVQKREGRIFEVLTESKVTFAELTKWYLGLRSVRNLASSKRVEQCLRNFNAVFGDRRAAEIKPQELEEYREGRLEQGASLATADMELSIAKTMVTRAFDNDKVDGRAVKPFRRLKRKLKAGANARGRILSIDEYLRLLRAAPEHLKPVLIVAMNTGMRKGELLSLKWSQIDRAAGMIRLAAGDTKEGRPKRVPINRYVAEVLEALPRAIHHDFVFTYRGKPIRNTFRKGLMKASERAGIVFGTDKPDGFRFHDIRATVKTYMLEAGVDRALRDAILGHSLRGMDAYYLRLTDAALKAGMDRYTAWLEARIAESPENVHQNVHQGVQGAGPAST